MYQLPGGLGSFNVLACLCISVGCVRLAVLWRFLRLVVTRCFKDLCGYNNEPRHVISNNVTFLQV